MGPTADGAEKSPQASNNHKVSYANAGVICYNDHLLETVFPSSVRGVVALAHVAVGMPFSSYRVTCFGTRYYITAIGLLLPSLPSACHFFPLQG